MSKLEFNIAAARAETDLGTCGAMLDNACNEIERLRAAHQITIESLERVVLSSEDREARLIAAVQYLNGLADDAGDNRRNAPAVNAVADIVRPKEKRP